MNQSARVYLIAGLTMLFLLLLNFLPPITIGDTKLRQIDILSELTEVPDTASAEPVRFSEQIKPKGKFRPQWKKGVVPMVDYGPDEKGGLDHFFDALLHAQSMDRPVRIAYYGDSFAAGDILVGELRHLLQQKFGGNGVGMIDACSKRNDNHFSIVQRTKGLEGFDAVNDVKTVDRRRLGVGQSYSEMTDSVASTTMRRTPLPYLTTWDNTIVYARTSSPLKVKASTGGAVTLKSSRRVQEARLKGGQDHVTVDFSGAPGTTLLGVSLEGKRGVVLDNFALVSNTGLSLVDLPSDMLKDFARLRPYDLVILQFGMNVVVDCGSKSYCEGYVRRMKRTVDHLRLLNPDVSVLVLGVSDMDRREDGKLATQKNIEKLSAYQQRMASELGCGFISIYEVMGGRNSMQTYVDRHWGEKDYTHLTVAGGKHLAGLLFESMMGALENYQRRKAPGN